MGSASFRKREHLCSTRLIETLFGAGSQSMAAYPLRAVFQTAPRCRGGVPVQILISVPKRHLKHAVDRNRVKRQVREAYRLCKTPLCETVPAGETLLVGFLWQADTTVASAKVADRVQKLVKRITEKLCDR